MTPNTLTSVYGIHVGQSRDGAQRTSVTAILCADGGTAGIPVPGHAASEVFATELLRGVTESQP